MGSLVQDSGENQHFVNQGYLRGFTIPGEKSLVWEYDKLTGDIFKRPKSVQKICSRPNYYAQWDKIGQQDNTTLERYFGKHLEGPTTSLIKGLHPNGDNRITLEGDNKGLMAFFIGMLLTRGPAFRDGVHDLHEQLVKKTYHLADARGLIRPMPQELKQEVDQHGLWNTLKIPIDSTVSIKPMIKAASGIARELLAKAWTFLIPAEGMTFVTADNPVNFHLPAELQDALGPIQIGPEHEQSEFTVPLRKDLMLICRPIECKSLDELLAACGGVTKATVDQTRTANNHTIASATRFVYASERSSAIKEQVGALKGTAQRIVCNG